MSDPDGATTGDRRTRRRPSERQGDDDQSPACRAEHLVTVEQGLAAMASADTEEACAARFTEALRCLVEGTRVHWWQEGSPPLEEVTVCQLSAALNSAQTVVHRHSEPILIPIAPERGARAVAVVTGRRSAEAVCLAAIRSLRHGLYVSLKSIGVSRQLRDATAQILQSERLQAMGHLAGGVAHDFNNLLMVLSAAAEVTAQSLGPRHPNANQLQLILETSERAAQLTDKLLRLSRKSRPQLEVVELHDLLHAVTDMLQLALDGAVSVSVTPCPGPCTIWADYTQLQSSLLNLCLNARDAMPSGGRLTLMTRRHCVSDTCDDLSERFVQLDDVTGERLPLAPGEYVSLDIADTGSGIEPATMLKIFEPFFTTKEAGSGTGLGLSVVRSTVEDHGGRIAVSSEVGRGTCFRLLLPLASTAAIRRGSVPPSRRVARSLRIFLADDDSEVCRATAQWLRHLGHNVQAIQDSARALSHLRDSATAYDLLVLDLKMPSPSGAQIYRVLRDRGAILPTVFVSGTPPDEALVPLLEVASVGFLRKPFRKAQLENAIDECLTPSPGAGGVKPSES